MGEVSPELLDTQVNPAVWEISGHMVLKRKKDYEEASEENAWKLLAEASLSEERFLEVKALIFEAVSCRVNEPDITAQGLIIEEDVVVLSVEDSPATKQGSYTAIVAGTHDRLVMQ